MAIEVQSNLTTRNEAVRPDNIYRPEDNAAIRQQQRENSLIGDDQQLIDQPPPPPPPYTLDINRQMQQAQSREFEENEIEQPRQVEARPITDVGANVQNLSRVITEEQTDALDQSQTLNANAIKSAQAISE